MDQAGVSRSYTHKHQHTHPNTHTHKFGHKHPHTHSLSHTLSAPCTWRGWRWPGELGNLPSRDATRHPAPCTLHPAPCTLHPAPCTLPPAPCPQPPAPSTGRGWRGPGELDNLPSRGTTRPGSSRTPPLHPLDSLSVLGRGDKSLRLLDSVSAFGFEYESLRPLDSLSAFDSGNESMRVRGDWRWFMGEVSGLPRVGVYGLE